AQVLLQPADLLADGRLRAVNSLAGASETAGIDHRDETLQQLEIEHFQSPFPGAPTTRFGRANDALRARQRRASGAPLMTLCDGACEGRTKAQMAAHNTGAATSGPSLLLFRFPSVDPLTCDLPGPRIEDQAHRLAGAIVQKGKAGMVAT